MQANNPDPPEGFTLLDLRQGFPQLIGPLYEKRSPDGSYVRAFRVEERHTNGLMNAHGGMLMAFADVAFGHAVSARDKVLWVTVRLLCDFLGPAALGEWVEGTGEILGVREGIYTVAGRIWVEQRPVISGVGLFKSIGPRRAP